MPLANQRGGAEALLQHLLLHPGKDYLPFLVFFEQGPMVEQARALGYDTTVVLATRLSDLPNYLSVTRSLRRWIKDRKLEVVLSWMPKAHLYLGLAALGTGVRVLWYQHCIPGTHPVDRVATLLPAHGILCCSKISLEAQSRIFPRRKTLLCYPGVVLESTQPTSRQQARERLGLPVSGPVIGMIARLERWKGAHIFVDAMERILSECPQATLFIVGGAHPLDPEYAAMLEQRVRSLRAANVILAGQRPADEIPLWHTAADIIVHPVTGPEPFGMAIVEAMGRGRVVIASNLGGPAEIIQNGVSGILIEENAANLLAEKVLHVLADRQHSAPMEQQAQLRSGTFSIENFARRFAELVLVSPGGSPS